MFSRKVAVEVKFQSSTNFPESGFCILFQELLAFSYMPRRIISVGRSGVSY